MDRHMEAIAGYYSCFGEFHRSERFSGTDRTVFTKSGNEYIWLVMDRKDKSTIQATLTDEHGYIKAWDDYSAGNEGIALIRAVRLAEDGRSQIAFERQELKLIDRIGDSDRRSTIGVLDKLSVENENPVTEKIIAAVRNKLLGLTDRTYEDFYSVIKRCKGGDTSRSLGDKLEGAERRAREINAANITTRSYIRSDRSL